MHDDHADWRIFPGLGLIMPKNDSWSFNFPRNGPFPIHSRETEEIQVALPPGVSKIELSYRAVVVNVNPDIDPRRELAVIPLFPYRIESKQSQIESGKHSELSFDVPAPWCADSQKWPRESGDLRSNAALRQLTDRFNDTLDRMRRDPTYSILSALQTTSLGVRTSWPAVVIAFPDGTFGGKRQYDADQIRTIVDWFYDFHWSWVPERIEIGPILASKDPEADRKLDQQMKEGILKLKDSLDEARKEVHAFKNIAARLDQVAK
jgi:hypothetical protein